MLLRGLTWVGVLSSWVLGTLSYAAFGAGGYVIVCLYFLIGTLVRRVGCWPGSFLRLWSGVVCNLSVRVPQPGLHRERGSGSSWGLALPGQQT